MKRWKWLVSSGIGATMATVIPVWAYGADITSVTAADGMGRTRLVLDVTEVPDGYSATYNETAGRLAVYLHDTANKVTKPVTHYGQGGVVTGVRLHSSGQGTELNIQTDRKIKYNITSLDGPSRIVIDLFTDYEQKLVRKVNEGTAVTKWHTGSESGRLEATVVTVTATTPVKTVAVDTGESLAEMATAVPKIKMLASDGSTVVSKNPVFIGAERESSDYKEVNATGLDEQKLRPTAELIFREGQGYKLYTVMPRVTARINGQKYEVDGINRERYADELIIYTSDMGPSTGTNEYGYEVAVKNNVVVGAYGHNAPLEPGTLVLSGHGKMAKILEQVIIGMPFALEAEEPFAMVRPEGHIVYNGGYSILSGNRYIGPAESPKIGRSFIGTVGDGSLLFLTVDNNADSVGVTTADGAHLLRALGATDGLEIADAGAVDIYGDEGYLHEAVDGQPSIYRKAISIG